MPKECVLVRVDASTELALKKGEQVLAGQPIGKSRCRDGYEYIPSPGIVNHIQFDPDTESLLVYIEITPPYPL